jgi:5-methylcytosine-specific restriction endonuclease McrA
MPKAKRADHYGAKSSFLKAKKIIYSTQSLCGICGRAVDFDKKFPDPWSATIDHIIPVAKGGDPASLENLQLAHLQCNRVKSSKLVQPQIKEKTISNRDLPLTFDWSTLK